jgi:hypothetical protein
MLETLALVALLAFLIGCCAGSSASLIAASQPLDATREEMSYILEKNFLKNLLAS